MRYYVTLFDSNYLTRGLVMYKSLMQHDPNAHLWIICFDDLAYKLLDRLNLSRVTLVSLSQFEDRELLRVKLERSHKEYCWSCTPSTALYVLNTEPHIDSIVYLDADLMFFSSLEPIFSEKNNASILLTEHRYLPEFDDSRVRGIYNVQFMYFKRNSEGLKALQQWREQCIEWCFDKCEDGKFGDQKYLDDWPKKFKDVHVVEHLGVGLAPWNAVQYSLSKLENKIYVEQDPLIFFHFHSLQLYRFNIGFCGNYPINSSLREWVYKPYFNEIREVYQQLRTISPEFKSGIVMPKFPRRPDKFYKFITTSLQQRKYCRYA